MRTFARIVWAGIVLAAFESLCAEGPGASTPKNDEALVLEFVDIKMGEQGATSPKVQRLAQSKNMAHVIRESLARVNNDEKKSLIIIAVTNLGWVRQENESGAITFLAAPNVVALLVELLDNADREVRAHAAGHLAQYCPDEAIRPHGLEIVAAVKKWGNTDAIGLLGMTGSAEARQLLLEDTRHRNCSMHGTERALAKLGDAELEKNFVKEFLSEKDPARKMDIANDLGYIGTPGAVAALASQLRAPEIVEWGAEKRPIRYYIIQGLRRAIPHNQLFWEPKRAPTSDEYYEPLEKWAEEVMQIKWDKPRPPFFYWAPLR